VIPLPDKKYSIIYSDPPWRYNARNNPKARFGLGVDGHYDTMTMKEILALPVVDIAEDNCALFLWTTFPYLNKQMAVFDAWGFKYKTLGFSWLKTNKGNGKPFFGIGYYAKSNLEVCLMGIRGKMKPVSNYVSSVVISPREEHSKKPSVVRDRIVELFGDIPRIELFARDSAEGWDSWGLEAPDIAP